MNGIIMVSDIKITFREQSMFTLYGDGIHDDTLAIQSLIDTSKNELSLPMPKVSYLISKPLELPSDFKLTLPRYAEIKLMDGSNCIMLTNKKVVDRADRLHCEHSSPVFDHINDYVNEYSPKCFSKNITVIGGIWNCNNKNQNPNPIQSEDTSVNGFYGYCMLFYCVDGLKISTLTVKDTTNYAMAIDSVSNFLVENITFDYNDGNPKRINMDGVHVNGNCHHGKIFNLNGACFDDLVALNADEGSLGDITDIEVDGLFAEGCHSAIRLLTVHQKIERISIKNVFGTYYQYCIGLTKFYKGTTDGYFDEIHIENVFASKAIRHPYLYPWPHEYVYPFIYITDDTVVKNVYVNGVRRSEFNVPVETVYVGKNTIVDKLSLKDVITLNKTEKPMPLLVNKGLIKTLELSNVNPTNDELLVNSGMIEKTI